MSPALKSDQQPGHAAMPAFETQLQPVSPVMLALEADHEGVGARCRTPPV